MTDARDPVKWENVEQICKRLNISRSKLYRLVKARKIPFHRLGGELTFDPIEVDEYLKKTGEPSTDTPLPV